MMVGLLTAPFHFPALRFIINARPKKLGNNHSINGAFSLQSNMVQIPITHGKPFDWPSEWLMKPQDPAPWNHRRLILIPLEPDLRSAEAKPLLCFCRGDHQHQLEVEKRDRLFLAAGTTTQSLFCQRSKNSLIHILAFNLTW
jgi:hypothetical protein